MDDNEDLDVELSHSGGWWLKLIAAIVVSTVLGIGLLAFTVDSFFMPGGNETFKELNKDREEIKGVNKQKNDGVI
ncbi:MAG: hypothetical protein AB8E87_03390 [Prochlorococcus sp.]|nr:hypothetical protein [Prochlorococcaceae cyanobacterium Fu_MAG_50]